MYYPCSENKDADQLRVTAKLICVFVFAHANCWFSHAQAQLYIGKISNDRQHTLKICLQFDSYKTI